MKFEHKNKLDTFLSQIDQYLPDKNNQTMVVFSLENVSPWNGNKLAEENEKLLLGASGKANVYMLYTSAKGSSTYQLRYIGKTTRKLARQRLRNHLFNITLPTCDTPAFRLHLGLEMAIV